MPWQRQVVDVALEVDPTTGLYVYSTVVVTVPRQAGKTTLVVSVGSHRCLTTRRGRVWYSAQTGKDAEEWLREEAMPLLEGERSLFRDQVTTRKSQGSTGVLWKPTESTFRAFAPLRDGLHGKQADLVFPDEAWAHDEARGAELRQAIIPTMATRPGAQTWPMSTAGDASSAYLLSYVQLGRASVLAGRREGVAHFEWSIPDDADPDDLDTVAAHHPAVGFTIGRAALVAARDDFADRPGEFARAYGNRWTVTSERVIPADAWQDRRVPVDQWTEPAPGSIALAFEVAVDRSDAAIAATWQPTSGGPLRVDVVDHRPGTGWLHQRMLELVEQRRPLAVGYNPRGPAVDVADRLQLAGMNLLPVGTSDYVAACAGLLAAVVDGGLEHRGHPALDDAAEAAATRPVGDAWAWAPRRSAGSIAALTAATVARWTFEHRPAPPARPVVAVARRRY